MNDNKLSQDEALKLIADAVFYSDKIRGNEDRVFDQLHDYIVDLNTPKQVFTCKGDVIDSLHAHQRCKAYWDSLYGQGYEIANWHYNGTTEPFDNFWEAAEEEFNKSE